MKYLIVLLMLCQVVIADDYTTYTKVGIGYILEKPKRIEFYNLDDKQPLYTGDNISYSIESGIAVPAEGGKYHFGVAWSDLLNQKGNRDSHRPFRLEVFGDHIWTFKYFDVKVGTGFKIYEDRYVNFVKDGEVISKVDIYKGFGGIKERVSARMVIFKKIGNYEIGLNHDSQWLVGKPFSNDYEYYKTDITIAYVF